MNAMVKQDVSARDALSDLLQQYSVEVTSRDAASVEAVAGSLRPGTEVFVANLPVRGNPQVRVIGDAETGYVVRINGGSSDFGLQTGGAGLGALAVDAAFAD